MDLNESPVKHILSLLEPNKLETSSQIAVQLAGCAEVFDFVDVSSLLDSIFEQEDANAQHSLALLVSNCPSETISEWLLEHFPADYYSELTSNAPFKALSMLSGTLISLMSTSPEIAPEVMRNHYLISVAPQLLAELLSFDPAVITSAQAESPVVHENDEIDGIRIKHKGQTQGKRRQLWGTPTLLSPLLRRHLSDLGIPLPMYQSDRERVAQAIIDYLQRALVLSIYELKQPATGSAVKRLLFKRPSQPAPAPAPARQRSISEANNEQIPSSFPQVQPMQESLYFDSVSGFGRWKVQIGGTVEKQFRELRKAKPDQFKAIVKKIKELSRGRFYDENQILLNEPHMEALSVFEARVGGTGIVYQVDCAWDNESELDTQVIKIYGIYPHPKINKQLWNSVAMQLGSKGEQYRYRCECRNPVTDGGSIFDPATFFPVKGGLPIGQALPDIDEKILEEIHALLTLEKFITLSQALLTSILANVEVMLPFEMTAQEKEVVQNPGSSFVIGRSGTGKTTSIIYKMLTIERAYALRLSDLGIDRPRQVFVTQSKVLATKVQEHFNKLLDSLVLASQSREEFRRMQLERRSRENDVMVDEDEEDELSGELPPRFSLLKPEHFPLFISFDRLCKLIEGDVLDTPNSRAQSVITYERFLETYWRQLSQMKGLDPVSLFSEFIGVIKGSEDTLSTPKGYLDADAYISLSHRTQPAFAHHRSEVYDLFMNYQRKKAFRGERDRADRTYKILEALKNNRIELLGTRIDFLYVDESQDNLLIDALLLRLLCKNPNGFFFAGDTAQTISAGCSFRFNDLKALMYRAEESHSATFGVPLPHSSAKTFQLAVNYRSHGGIVDAARSITELITHFFPYSIDNLEPERGVVAGSKPVFFQGFEEFSTTEFEKFFFGDRKDHIEFGAAQCILVRDEAAQARLREKVGDIGLIMTLYDCKGLEFNDVLLFNFFDGSPVELKSWQTLLNAIPLELGEYVPAFDEFRHASISSELKKLYVAVTRAKRNLWIVDQSEKSEPMRRLWASKDQIYCRTPADGIPQLTVESSEDEWAKQGLNLFQHKRYYQAQDCFKRARLAKEVDICQAYCLREEAQKLATDTTEQKKINARNQAFIAAAAAFVHSAQHPAEKGKAKRAYFRIAGECYEVAQKFELAAESYVQAREFNTAAKIYRRLEMFGSAVDVIHAHREDMDEEVIDGIMNVARLYYFTKQDLSKANALFDSSDEAITFLKDRDLDVAEATLLESLGKDVEAAQIHLIEGRVLQAAQLFFKNPANQEAIRLGVDAVVPALWKCITFGGGWKKNDSLGHELLGLLNTVDLSLLEHALKDEVTMFQAIACHSPTHPEFGRLGRAFAAASNWPASLLCFDSLFTNPPQVQVVSGSQAVEIIKDFLHYARMLREAALHPSPQNEERFQKLFGFSPHGSGRFLISQGTALYTWAEHSRSATPQEHMDYGLVVSGDTLCSLLQEFLRLRLINRIKLEHQACRRAQALDPCLFFTLQGHCGKLDCKRQHVPATAASELVTTYRARVRLHMQQFLILQMWHLEDTPKHDAALQLNEWVDHLYQAMFPPHPVLGVLSDLDIKGIPEFGATLNLLRTVSRNITYQEKPTQFSHTSPRLMTRFMQIAFYGFTYDPIEALVYVKRAACWTAPKPPSFIREGNTFIISDVFFSYMGKDKSLADGISLIRHIVMTKLCVDVGVLCDYVDRQVALFCATQKWNSSTPLHSLTLPRSWMLHLLQSNTYTSLRDIARGTSTPIKFLVNLLTELTGDIFRRTFDYLFYDGKSLSQLGAVVVSTFMLRLFRAISYLGYNARFDAKLIRLDISRFFRSFQRAYTVSNSSSLIFTLLASYANISDWGGIVRLIHKEQFKADITTRLQHSSFKSEGFPGIQTVTFTMLDDALMQLSQPTSSLKALALDSELSQNQLASLEQDVQPGAEEVEAVQEKHESSVESENRDGLKAAPPTQDEISAACKIQSTYREWKQRVQFRSFNKRSYHKHLVDCVKKAQDIAWSQDSYYKRLFFVGLPYILDTLDKLTNHVLSLKKETKKQLDARDTSHFEMVNERLTDLVKLLKEIKNIQLVLQPKSDVHNRRDLKALRENVQKVWDLFHRKGGGWDHAISGKYLQDGYRVIMSQKKQPEKKPKLNTEDLDEC